MKMNTVFNEDGLMKNGKQFSRMANFLNEKENNFFSDENVKAVLVRLTEIIES